MIRSIKLLFILRLPEDPLKFSLFCFLLFSLTAQASTFVGNGGNVNDVELKVTLKQIEMTVAELLNYKKSKTKNQICVCAPGYEDHPLCEVIKSMNQEQVEFCENFVFEQMEELGQALSAAEFEWANENLQVQEKNQIRSADAVTIPDKKKIYLKQEGFNSLAPMNRMFLVTHELYHIVPYNKKTIHDDEPIGPFKTDKGGRQLLNSAAAGLTMASLDKRIFQTQTSYLSISKYIRRHWVSLFTPMIELDSDRTTNFKLKPAGVRLTYRYQPSQEDGYGISLHAESTSQKEKVLGTINVEESRSLFGAGVNYRWMPFKDRDPLSYLRNSHFVFEFLLENISGKYSVVEEPFVNEKYTASNTAPSVKVHYLYPFKNNFWIDLGASIDNHKLNYPVLNLNYSKNSNVHLFFGVTYGF